MEIKIANEQPIRPKVSAEFVTFWLHRFRKLDVQQQSHRKMLIDTFANAIYLYDDKMVIAFNYKDGTKTTTFDEVNTALAKQNMGSNLDCLGALQSDKQSDRKEPVWETVQVLFLCRKKTVGSARSCPEGYRGPRGIPGTKGR